MPAPRPLHPARSLFTRLPNNGVKTLWQTEEGCEFRAHPLAGATQRAKGGVQGEWGVSGINAEAAPARAAGPGSAWVQPRRRPAGHFALSSSGGGFGSRLDESFRWIYGLTPGEFHNNKLNVT